MELLFPLLIVFMIGMIFVSNRQRKKQQQQQEQLQNSLHVGDIVVMTSGISGTIVDADDERTIDLEIAPDVVTTWLRAAVREKIGGDDATDAQTGRDADSTAGTAEGSAAVAASEPDDAVVAGPDRAAADPAGAPDAPATRSTG